MKCNSVDQIYHHKITVISKYNMNSCSENMGSQFQNPVLFINDFKKKKKLMQFFKIKKKYKSPLLDPVF